MIEKDSFKENIKDVIRTGSAFYRFQGVCGEGEWKDVNFLPSVRKDSRKSLVIDIIVTMGLVLICGGVMYIRFRVWGK